MQAFAVSLVRLPLHRPRSHFLTSARPHSVTLRRLVRVMTILPATATPAEAHALLKQPPSKVYLDVRTPAEFKAAHPPAAVNIPVTLDFKHPVPTFAQDVEKVLTKDAPIIVGCKSGKRSAMAIELLKEAGYGQLTNVKGGFLAWEDDSSLPVERSS